MNGTRKLWISLGAVVFLSFAVLGYYGWEIYRQAPPVPKQVVTTEGQLVFTADDIQTGQQVWQSTGGQELGSVWGHGSYHAPDWSADWLHREAVFILNRWAQTTANSEFDHLKADDKVLLNERLKREMRTNTFDPETGTLTISPERAAAIQANSEYYSSIFMGDPKMASLREQYAMKDFTVIQADRMAAMNAFFFWTAWAAVTERPGEKITYTNNWPADKLVGNEPASSLLLWTGFSVILLLAGIGALSAYYASHNEEPLDTSKLPKQDPLLALRPTPSMRATLKYFWVVTALIVVQILLGIVTAHYGVEGTAFYGFPLAEILPYSVTRTWHLQLGIFWIATSWLATGLFVAPAVSGYEPKFQKLGVDFLFGCLLIIVVGSLVGQWFGVMQKLDLATNFWIGHQGLEYVDLGRFWQIFLSVGLFLWLFLMTRAIWPAFSLDREGRHLLALFLISSAAIALFYLAGLMWGRTSNLAIIEYWRWWVVHLWVEGFFEVFATVVIAFLFVRMGLLGVRLATQTVLFSTIIFLAGGILGTFHHLYFSGTPTAVLAIGASFSALEVVPLVLIGFEAYQNLRLGRAAPWVQAYRWPIYCFISVAFWNLVGAGIFGFLINPPIALYYMQGLNTTPVHAHSALFGVYGMLGIGLMLFVLKGLAGRQIWKNKLIKFSLWSINIGLGLMILLSPLPMGFMQTLAAFDQGYWYARSAEFMQTPLLDTLRWLRVIGDTLFAIGIFGLAIFVLGLKTGWSTEKGTSDLPQEGVIRPVRA
jgi:nitric oxide reductase subunit B